MAKGNRNKTYSRNCCSCTHMNIIMCKNHANVQNLHLNDCPFAHWNFQMVLMKLTNTLL